MALVVSPVVLPLNQSLLIFLQPLVLHFFLSNELNGELSGLVNDVGISLFLPLTGSLSFHNFIEDYRAGVDVFSFEEFLADLDFASDNRVHFEFKQFPHYQLHLGSHESFLNHRVRSDVKVRFVHV